MSEIFGGMGGPMAPSDKGLKFGLADTFRLAWQDEDLRSRIMFVLGVFAVFALCVHVPVPVPGVDMAELSQLLATNPALSIFNIFGGRALQNISILALGLNPYITSSIIMQILMAANPAWKKEVQENGEYGRRQQNKRTRILTLGLCIAQGWGLVGLLGSQVPTFGALPPAAKATIVLFWTAGAMLMMFLGEQISERGIGNGMSLLIFAGIIIAFPGTMQVILGQAGATEGFWFRLFAVFILFLASTWFVVYFTIAQRRIPIQHVRRQFGTKAMGGGTSYLPFSVVMVGVIPIIFAVALVAIPQQIAGMFPVASQQHQIFANIAMFLYPDFTRWQGWVGALSYTALIFFFSYFYTAVQFNVGDISNNLKRHGSMIPGVRPGKQTKDFLDGVISRITIVGAAFLATVALSAYLVPLILAAPQLLLIFGTSLLIMVQVALETMRQIESNLLMKQYGQ